MNRWIAKGKGLWQRRTLPPPAHGFVPLSIDVRVQVGEEEGSYCTWGYASLAGGDMQSWFNSFDDKPLRDVTRWQDQGAAPESNLITRKAS